MPRNKQGRRFEARQTALLALLTAFLVSASPRAASRTSREPQGSFLRITPSTVVVSLGQVANLNLIDSSGRPVPGASWSLSEPVAELLPADDSVGVRPRVSGKAVLSAAVGSLTAAAAISVAPADNPGPTTVLWSVDPWPGYESLLVRQAVLTADGPELFDVEWSPTSPAIVRALRGDGRQMWMAQLHALAGPQTIKRKALPPMAKSVYQGEPPQNATSAVFARRGGAGTAARVQHPELFPPEGQSILVRDSGDGFGGWLYLERGAASDALVDLDATGKEPWRYRSPGRLIDSWTINGEGDVGIVELQSDPPLSSLLMLNGKTGEVRFRVAFPTSSTAIKELDCGEGNTLTNTRPSQSGAPFTSTDGRLYLQVAVHNEWVIQPCPTGSYFFDNTLFLVSVGTDGKAEWKVLARSHADGEGMFHVQPRVFAGESIPDGLGGVLAAWTYFSPGNKDGEKPHAEARLSRVGSDDLREFTLPFPAWAADPSGLFDDNMVLGEEDTLYATNHQALLSFHIPAGEIKWIRQPPAGRVDLEYATGGGGVLVSNQGQFTHFDGQGRGLILPWTVALPGSADDIGLVQSDLPAMGPGTQLALRNAQLFMVGRYLAVEDGAPVGRGRVLQFSIR